MKKHSITISIIGLIILAGLVFFLFPKSNKSSLLCIVNEDSSFGPFIYASKEGLQIENLVHPVIIDSYMKGEKGSRGVSKNLSKWINKKFYLYSNSKLVGTFNTFKETHTASALDDSDTALLIGTPNYSVSLNSSVICFSEKRSPCKVVKYDAKILDNALNAYIADVLETKNSMNVTSREVTVNFIGDIDNDGLNEVFFTVFGLIKEYEKDYYYGIATLKDGQLLPIYENIQKKQSLSGDTFEAFFDIIDINNDGRFEVINYSGPYWQVGYSINSIKNKKLNRILVDSVLTTS